MKRTSKYLMFAGVSLSVLAAVIFLLLALSNSPLILGHKNVYLCLLYMLFVAYTGPIFLISGAFLWSLTMGWKVKLATWVILISLLLVAFVPFPEKCIYIGDVGQCETIFPDEIEYWTLAWRSIGDSNVRQSAQWHSLGMFIYIREGFGDILTDIGRVKNGTYWVNGVNLFPIQP